MAKPLKFYYDLMSQPCRALYITLEMAKIPYEKKVVALRKGIIWNFIVNFDPFILISITISGEHMTEDFAKINRFQKVPVIDDNGFKLAESVAILHYLDRKHEFPGLKTLYPESINEKALVDEYLQWQHLNTRANCAMYFIYHWMLPMLNGSVPEAKKSRDITARMERTLDDLENIWLKEGQRFLTGDRLTAADIWAACELEQPSEYSNS